MMAASRPIEAWSRASKVAAFTGAAVSAGFTLWAGRHNPSLLLPVVFIGWVLLPYAGLLAARRVAGRFPSGIAAAMHAAIVALALFPAVLYAAVATFAPGHPATFAFLTVPVASWLAIATLMVAPRLARRP